MRGRIKESHWVITIFILQKAQSHISTVFGQFSYLNMCYSHLNCVLHLTMTDVAKAIQDLCDQFKSLREDVDTLKKQRKTKKSKSRKSYSHSPSRNRRYHSQSRARSISPRNRERSSHPRSGARISHH